MDPQDSIILTMGTPKMVPMILGNSHMKFLGEMSSFKCCE